MQKQKLFRRIGCSRLVRILLFVTGVCLCTYPITSRFITEKTTQNIILEDEMIAVLEIPKIELKLPIYHGTEEETLAKGVGHISESDLPVGGESTHSLLAGHRGLPNAQLFTRLNELEVGDVFVIHLYGLEHTYEVCEISVIKPEDTDVLAVQEGRELISLITCTPYGINTHRLIVTGERKEEP